MALIYADESAWDTLADTERESFHARYQALAGEARAAGVMRGGEQLASTGDATTVRTRDRQTLVTDGPYAETKEALGGYFLFECDSIDDAVDWAARIPAVAYGAVEVRPVYVDSAQA